MIATKDVLEIIKKHSQTYPVAIYEIIHEVGLKLDIEELAANVSGYIKRDGGQYRIAINEGHATSRQRFTAAHELAHYIYHRDLLGAGVDDTVMYRAEGHILPNPSIKPMHERQANTFAANVLMPNALINRLRAQNITAPEQMAAALGVSEAAMRIKLGTVAAPRFDDVQDDD